MIAVEYAFLSKLENANSQKLKALYKNKRKIIKLNAKSIDK